MNELVTGTLGWTATAAVVASYFFRRIESLRVVQMIGATLWLAYGAAIGSGPVLVANIMVLAAAAFAAWRDRHPRGAAPPA
jgi:hypothetical protein